MNHNDHLDDLADDTLVIDCGRCEVRGDACSDCVVSVLLGAPPAVEWDGEERRAVDALAEAGMVPRLRLVEGDSGPDIPVRQRRCAG